MSLGRCITVTKLVTVLGEILFLVGTPAKESTSFEGEKVEGRSLSIINILADRINDSFRERILKFAAGSTHSNLM